MLFILADTHWKRLLPLTFTRSVSDIYMGIDRIVDKWERLLGTKPAQATAAHLALSYPVSISHSQYVVNSAALPTALLVDAIRGLSPNEMLTWHGQFIAATCTWAEAADLLNKIGQGDRIAPTHLAKAEVAYPHDLTYLGSPADIFAGNDAALRADFDALTKGFRTTHVPDDVLVKGDQLYVAPGAVLQHCVLNTTTGPIYIGEHAEVMEGCLIRGPFALGAHSQVKMGAKIYGPTTIAPYCRVGGEVNNSVMLPYSNKGHDGFLGNSVVGSWCNLGADTNTSNLKNNYSEVKVWNYEHSRYEASGRQFHGLIMGDHAKAGINTMFNTGTVAGLCANVFDGGFPPKFIPSFSWGGAGGFETFRMEKAIEAARAMMERRGVAFTTSHEEAFRFAYQHDAHYRDHTLPLAR